MSTMMPMGRVERVTSIEALEAELTAANLSMYLRVTPMEQIQWREVSAAWDRLDRPRENRPLHEAC